MEKCYSYVVARDYGFAPNPFHGVLTLADCKQQIRKVAKVGDWVIGHSSKKLGQKLIYMMKVTEVLTFDQYWYDPRYLIKRPCMNGSLVTMYGDNIYHHDEIGEWKQEDSHHSLEHGITNQLNLKRDTGTTDRVLISAEFIYLGKSMMEMPENMRGYIHPTQGHRSVDMKLAMQIWNLLVEHYPEKGLIDDPLLFNTYKRYDGK